MNIFVYGTLISESNQKIITGKSFSRERAVLRNYRKVTSAVCFPFIVPYRGSEVEGYILYDIDHDSLAKMDKYEAEGDLYFRRTVIVDIENRDDSVECDVYIGNVRSIRNYFMPGTDIDDRIEKYVETEIDELLISDFLTSQLPQKQDFAKAIGDKRIIKELFGANVEEIVQTHVSRFNLSLSFLAKNLKKTGLPSLENIKGNQEIAPYADNYIHFAVRHIIFNQIEDQVRDDFTGEVKVKHQFFAHTISVMLALELMNNNHKQIEELIARYKANVMHNDWEYTDYAEKAIKIADTVYDYQQIARQVDVVKKNRNVGATPLGAELEFSTVGRYAVHKEKPIDPLYNHFHYFHDFDFTRRMWKLGGHVDDHRYIDPDRGRSYGFLEYAFGRFRIYGDLSKPVTLDPWVLNRLINEATRFTGIRTHSLHISIQADQPIKFDRPNEINHLLCLLLLGGDLGYDQYGILREKRIFNKEIVDSAGLVRFNTENIHYADEERQEKSVVIEYQFPRLYKEFNYQPLIMALKGYQIALNPRPLCLAESVDNIAHAEMNALKGWAENPSPLDEKDINDFLKIVEYGLMNEDDGQPAHKLTYIKKNLSLLSVQLKAKNKFIQLNS
ncbi:MAG: gamma-glutamylcyclotransferase [Candidatus Auribacter fodinae]|jgi:gamma-glutamylcyclotransferase (GGCT)/AIG2-like uncharacterized protein YtfP|uniref:Putative gamma-glutamylcyclotransferase n=1 Tax=Candidatus Auribacter fodinae TaxID=2093366 RepID=A0A3A4R607_9BACT|nr:MAG: gamma-glutamylcyclotransferase [Candidatus Auribacter fodinae]